ncbi:hypothetical protein SDC9_94400 [bioreactor metagenome]|uniref:Uncharacterized protein n=1 Tax=bioreactor metagenome TaxID=1076179 RepID=A0A645A3P2_9ZZZZ
MRLFVDHIFRALELPLAVAFSGTDDISGALQFPDRLADRVDALHADKG